MRRYRLACLPLALVLLVHPLGAQEKPTLTPADYARWESLGATELSADGRWLAYELRRVDEDVALLIRELATDSVRRIEHATRPSFSADSRWVAYLVGVSRQEQERAEESKKPVHTRLQHVDLVKGTVSAVADVASFQFSGDGRYLAWRGYPPEGRQGKGADLVVRDLSAGLDTNFGNVSEFAWQQEGSLLGMVIDAVGRAGNGVQLYSPAAGNLRTLESDTASYAGLVWRKKADDLAVFKVRHSADHDTTSNDLLAWRSLASGRSLSHHLDALELSGLPADTRVTEARPLVWADDGSTVFFGVQPWERKSKPAPPDSARSDSARVGGDSAAVKVKVAVDSAVAKPVGDSAAAKAAVKPVGDSSASKPVAKSVGDSSAAKPAPKEDPAGVEVWHARDVDIIPEQKVRSQRDRNRSGLVAWHLPEDRLVRLGGDLMEEVALAAGQKVAVGLDGKPYDRERMFGPIYRDLYVMDVASGDRVKAADRIEFQFGPSATGRYLLYLRDNHYWVYDRSTRQHTNITAKLGTGFINFRDDHTVKQKPPYGVGGWLEDDKAVWLYDQYDIWEVRPDGSGGVRLSDGAAGKLRHRRVWLDPDEDRFVDWARPIFVTLYGELTKQYGYGRLRRGGRVEHLVLLDKQVGRLTKAKRAGTYLYRVEGFDDSPDYFVGGERLADARQVTATNTFQGDYAWGRSELIDYLNTRGDSLQAALHYPANYQPGRKYPMIVYFYEITSNQLHAYAVPSERTPYNPTVYTQDGYFVLRPDITYRDRNPGRSAVEALVPAVDRVVQLGLVDSTKVGIVGHSWGAYQTAYTVTQTDRFAAAVAGAPLTDLVSMYLSVYWNSGGTDARIFEVSQGRMEVPPWEDLEAYMKNSPLFNIATLNTPLLVAFGDKDGAVDWHQGIELYNAARRADKDLVLLVYEGENHSLAKKPNQLDYHRRIRQWFAHYLKGEPATDWMVSGVKYLDRQKQLEQAKKATTR